MSIPTEHYAADIKTSTAPGPDIDVEKANASTPAQTPAYIPVPLAILDTHSAFVECPYCNVQAQTDVTYTPSGSTHAMGLGCCCLLGILGVWMPYVFHWGADADHFCSSCKRPLVHVDNSGARIVHVAPSQQRGEKEGYEAPQGMGMDAGVKSGQMQGEVRGQGGMEGETIQHVPVPGYVQSQQQQVVHTEVKSPVMPSAC